MRRTILLPSNSAYAFREFKFIFEFDTEMLCQGHPKHLIENCHSLLRSGRPAYSVLYGMLNLRFTQFRAAGTSVLYRMLNLLQTTHPTTKHKHNPPHPTKPVSETQCRHAVSSLLSSERPAHCPVQNVESAGLGNAVPARCVKQNKGQHKHLIEDGDSLLSSERPAHTVLYRMLNLRGSETQCRHAFTQFRAAGTHCPVQNVESAGLGNAVPARCVKFTPFRATGTSCPVQNVETAGLGNAVPSCCVKVNVNI
ncbi:hypothetical protein J6590_008290 [Homalodisca vitripennis]|nr:hypothetical protein J6590_008290 [Homalodisca vitripennis]